MWSKDTSLGKSLSLISNNNHNAVQESDMFRGMVLMGPLITLDPAMASPIKVLLAKAASRVLPSFALGGLDPALVTSDQVRLVDTTMIITTIFW